MRDATGDGSQADWRASRQDWFVPRPAPVDFAIVGDGAWTAWHEERYRSRGYGGVSIESTPMSSLDFVGELPGLTTLVVLTRVRDDRAAYEVASLERLDLLDRCRKPLRAGRLEALAHLSLDARPGLEQIENLPSLTSLNVYEHKGPDLAWLSSPTLQAFHVVGRNQPVDVSRLGTLPAVRSVSLVDAQLSGLEALAGLPGLRAVRLGADHRRSAMWAPVDLAPLADCPHLEMLAVSGLAVASWAPLARCRSLVLADVRDGDAVDGRPSPVGHLPRYTDDL